MVWLVHPQSEALAWIHLKCHSGSAAVKYAGPHLSGRNRLLQSLVWGYILSVVIKVQWGGLEKDSKDWKSVEKNKIKTKNLSFWKGPVMVGEAHLFKEHNHLDTFSCVLGWQRYKLFFLGHDNHNVETHGQQTRTIKQLSALFGKAMYAGKVTNNYFNKMMSSNDSILYGNKH